jgi:hypothetical protein
VPNRFLLSRLSVFVIGLALCGVNSVAQTIDRPRNTVNPKDDAGHDLLPASKPSNVVALPQAAVSVGSTKPVVQLQALELYFTPSINAWRFEVSAMLPTSTTSTAVTGQAAGGAAPSKPAPNDYLKASLLDETGGLVNTSLRFYKTQPIKGLTDPSDTTHGISTDLRTGVKFVDIPQDSNSNAAQSASSALNVCPFWTTTAQIKMSLNLFEFGNDGKFSNAGGLVFALTGVSSYALDSTYVTRFNTTLKRSLLNANAAVAISLSKRFYIEAKGTFATNDDAIGKRLVFQLNALPGS